MQLKEIQFHHRKRHCSSVTMRSLLKLKPVADEQVFYDEFVNMTSALSEKATISDKTLWTKYKNKVQVQCIRPPHPPFNVDGKSMG